MQHYHHRNIELSRPNQGTQNQLCQAYVYHHPLSMLLIFCNIY